MAEQPAASKRQATHVKEWVTVAFWICVGFAILFAAGFVLSVVGNLIEASAAYATDRVLPVAFRELMLWLADDVLPEIAPLVSWMQSFGTAWNGLLTFISFVLAVISIVLAFALSAKSRDDKTK